MATYRILTYVRAESDGFQVSVTCIRADVEHSVPISDGETGKASTREEAVRVRSEFVERLSKKIRGRGDDVIQVRELGDLR